MWRILLMVSLLCWSADGQRVTCRDNNNGEVDWYIIYKAPKLNNIGTTGLEYLYIDSNDRMIKTFKDKMKDKLINNDKGVLANTLRPILKQTKDMTENFGFISYSDQPPGCHADDKFGHSKGVVMMNKTNTGVWLSHSVPQFPFTRDPDNFYPPSGAAKAQTFICVTFNYDQFNKIGEHLLDIAAFSFDHHLPDGLDKEITELFKKVINKNFKERPEPQKTSKKLKSAAETEFRSFAKQQYKEPKRPKVSLRTEEPAPRKLLINTKGKPEPVVITRPPLPRIREPAPGKMVIKEDPKGKYVGDLYLDIAENYTTDVRVQTWPCKQDGDYCEERKVINIKSVNTALGGWEAGVDHSKWCVAKDNNNHLICIADVNRADSQYERPGGALCFIHKEASELFKGLINQTDDCSGKRPRDPDCDSDDD